MKGLLRLQNRTRERLKLALLRRVAVHILENILSRRDYDMCVWLVADEEMIRTNEGRLRHKGTTDVITFDYGSQEPGATLAGELFICLDEARRQADRYNATPGQELTRYLVHGLLHLTGYDDQQPADRRIMKSAENKFLKKLEEHFNLEMLQMPQRKPRQRKHATR